MESLRAGLVGLGSVSQRGILPHLAQPDAQEKLRLVAVADVVTERAREMAERFHVPSFFSSLEEMLAGAALDLVIVASPIQLHVSHALAAIEAGKHVYVQKTMTTTLAEADALLAARDRKGIKLAAAPGFDLCLTTDRMRQIVNDGVLGRIYNVYTYTWGAAFHRDPKPGTRDPLAEIDPTWNFQPGGGPLPNVTVYALQLATSVVGPVRRVTALSTRLTREWRWGERTIPVEVDDNTMLVLEFASGALGSAVGSAGRAGACTPWGGFSLHGDAGTLEVTTVHQPSGYPLAFEVRGGRWEGDSDRSPRYATEIAEQPYLQGEHAAIPEPHVYADIMDLVDAVRADRSPMATGEQARHVVEIIEKAQIAARTGVTQEMTTSFVSRGGRCAPGA